MKLVRFVACNNYDGFSHHRFMYFQENPFHYFKNRQLWVFEHFQNQRTAGSDYWSKQVRVKELWVLQLFDKLQRTVGFHERIDKDPKVLGGYTKCFLENHDSIY